MAYKILIFYERKIFLKGIGERLKTSREDSGLSLEEVSQDLKTSKSFLDSIENGKKEDFNDIYELKELIKKYAKYLGLNIEDISKDFDEYLFDFTSKVPVSEIKKEMEEKKVVSPYTKIKKEKSKKIVFIFIFIFILLVLGFILFI